MIYLNNEPIYVGIDSFLTVIINRESWGLALQGQPFFWSVMTAIIAIAWIILTGFIVHRILLFIERKRK